MKEKVLDIIKKYNLIENGDKVVIGVSGGPDSITLLNVLLEIKNDKAIDFEMVVCHVNHMIREEAVLDEQYVLEFCKKYNIECFAKRIDVANKAEQEKIGTEEAGRNARYEFFKDQDIFFSEENPRVMFIGSNRFKQLYGVGNEEIVQQYDYNKMVKGNTNERTI